MTDVIYGSLPTSNDIKGTLAAEEKMSGNLATVFAKDGKSAYEVAVKNGFEGTEEEWLASLQGKQGIQGIQGEKGDKGDKGDTGAQGIQGEKGDKGDKGDTGEQGIQGIQGKQGEKGDKGDPFTYSDFTSEQLASLKGEKGDKGDKGNTGEKGDTGNSGVYLGSGDMPDDCNVQIDPEGDVLTPEDLTAWKEEAISEVLSDEKVSEVIMAEENAIKNAELASASEKNAKSYENAAYSSAKSAELSALNASNLVMTATQKLNAVSQEANRATEAADRSENAAANAVKASIEQATGDSTEKTMSQKAITDLVSSIIDAIANVNKISSVTLLVDNWEGEASPYHQAVTISGATENSKIDLNPTIEQLNIFHNKDIAFVVENNNGATTVYCIGQKPTSDYTIQATITEVAIDG